MKCPYCGSEHTTTIVDRRTNQKDYSLGSGCCGYLLFGVWGLLCGLCGAGTETTESVTHVCNDCGKTF